jgi:phage-related minor tail protein
MAEGGVVTKPTLAVVGESGPEAVIPLDRAGSLGQGQAQITVQQTNHFEMNGTSDDQVRQIMRSISDVTRSGAAEGAEMVKSIMAQQDRLAGQSV